MAEIHMMTAVREQIPANASFFRILIWTFHKMFVETTITKRMSIVVQQEDCK